MTTEAMRKALAIASLGLFVGVLAACEEQGPAEEAGEAIDNAAENAGDAIEDAGDEVQENAN